MIRPFTAKWHRISLGSGFDEPQVINQFREELNQLQIVLRNYSGLLSVLADVEDLTELEEVD